MDRLLTQLQVAQPTYPETRFTLAGNEPSGFRNDHCEAELGKGADTFARAVDGLRAWGAHRVPGIQVFPRHAEIVVGATVIVTLGTPLAIVACPASHIEATCRPEDGRALGNFVRAAADRTDATGAVASVLL